MAAKHEDLLAYLSHALPRIPHGPDVSPGPNTSNPDYRPEDITYVGNWAAFTYQDIINGWGAVLHGPGCARLNQEPAWGSPCQPIYSESQFKSRFSVYAESRIRRAIRAGVAHINGNNNQGLAQRGMRSVEFLHGDGAATPKGFRPDYAIAIQSNQPADQKVNRCPGGAKVSWKWQCAWRNEDDLSRLTEFKQVLAQVNWYMKQHETRYCYVCTDEELIPIRRLDRDGRLELGPRIPWTASNIIEPGNLGYNSNHATYTQSLTPLLGVWYLGMLAANDQGYHLH